MLTDEFFPFDLTDMHAGIGLMLDGVAARRASEHRSNGKGWGRAARGTTE